MRMTLTCRVCIFPLTWPFMLLDQTAATDNQKRLMLVNKLSMKTLKRADCFSGHLKSNVILNKITDSSSLSIYKPTTPFIFEYSFRLTCLVWSPGTKKKEQEWPFSLMYYFPETAPKTWSIVEALSVYDKKYPNYSFWDVLDILKLDLIQFQTAQRSLRKYIDPFVDQITVIRFG